VSKSISRLPSNENKKIKSDIVLSAVGIKTNIDNIGLGGNWNKS
jgi:pyruvate/2-oxoglutarate dehydrogenase complex dihydrolipoamide dehydrogenase (E3) component